MKLNIPIEVDFDDMKSLLDDIEKLQTYKLSEGDKMVLVDVDDVADVLMKHIKAQEKQPECEDAISRQAAIDALDCINGAEEVLKALPSAQPEQSIAQERYDDLCEYFKDCSDQGRSTLTDRKEFKSWLDRMKWHVMECDKLGRELEKLKSAQPERKRGEWIENETSFADGVRQTCTCSVCGIRSVRPLGNFCRWCGADMRGGDVSEE